MRAAVLGGGLAGTLTAAALAEHADEVVVVERDVLPDGPHPRKGLPQAVHGHVLWSAGARAMERLLPGVTGRWLASGAHRLPLPAGILNHTPFGWRRRWRTEPASHYYLSMSRDLLDWGVREALRAGPHAGRVRVLCGAEPVRLLGGPDRVRGVTVRHGDGATGDIPADLVVDATGRSALGVRLLEALGAGPVPVSEVDAGVVYATRDHVAPAGHEAFPVVVVQGDPAAGVPGRMATFIPIEGGVWRIVVSGTRGAQPSRDAELFEAFARRAAHPFVAELIRAATPAGEVHTSRSTGNRRYHYERVRGLPDGFLALGDALAAYNPCYGHGMSAAAMGAVALNRFYHGRGLADRGAARRAQRAVVRRSVTTPWTLATQQDMFYPGARGTRPTRADRVVSAYVRRVMATACGCATADRALTGVIALDKPLSVFFAPSVLWHALRGPAAPRLPEPDLSPGERRLLAGRDACSSGEAECA
ncbi:pyridine nucleotide-disulfide oxidoreductase [Streptomyces sp. SW4]|nr:pyridine nucleotide-disulfide oxidoreductase [Streptomyces sp. SW4]